MLAKQNLILEDAVETIYELTADEAIRQQCIAREKHVREMKTILGAKERAEQEKDRAEREKERAEQDRARAEQARDETIQELEQERQQRIVSEQRNDQLVRQIEQLMQENRRLKEQQTTNMN